MNNGGRIGNYNGYYPRGYVAPNNYQQRQQIPQRVQQKYYQTRINQPAYNQRGYNQNMYPQNGYPQVVYFIEPNNVPQGYNQNIQSQNRYSGPVGVPQGYYPNGYPQRVIDPRVQEELDRKRKVRNKVIALGLAGSVALSGFIMFLNKKQHESDQSNNPGYTDGMNGDYNNPSVTPVITANPTSVPTPVPTAIPTAVPTPEPTPEPQIGGDSIVTTKEVNLRLSPDEDSFKIGSLYQGAVVDRLFTDGKWDLIRVGNTLAYVYSKNTRTNDIDYNYEYYDIEEYKDVVYTTSGLNFRTGPSTNEKSLLMLDKNEQLVVVGKAILRNNPNDVWYLAKARGKIGFVSAAYTRSIRNDVLHFSPFIGEVEIRELARVSKDSYLYDDHNNPISFIETHQLLSVLASYGDYTLVDYNGTVGYIKNSHIKKIKDNLLAVDLSDQRVFYYVKGELAYYGKCTTGADETPTDKGFFHPYAKGDHHDFGHNGYKANILWMPFNGGQGFHDAFWEPENKFGDPKYRAKHGSAGCVRLPNIVAIFIYENVSMKTPVLIKE